MTKSKQTPDREQLIAAVRAALRRLAGELDALDGRVARHFGVNRTDQHCLDLLTSRGPLTPSELAGATSLTSGGMTIALDRLERAGWIRRVGNPGDRRSVLVEATDLTRRHGRELFSPLATAEHRLLSGLRRRQLRAIHGFLDGLAAEIAELRPPAAPSRGRARARPSANLPPVLDGPRPMLPADPTQEE